MIRLTDLTNIFRSMVPRHRVTLFFLSVALVLTVAACNARNSETHNLTESSASEGANPPGGGPAEPHSCVNLNNATAGELKTLPGIGDVMAQRIIDYRERHGRLRRPEEIIIIEGFSERRYKAIAGLVCVE